MSAGGWKRIAQVGFLLLALCRVGFPADLELLTNGDFEKSGPGGLPLGWTLNGIGSAEISADAHGGKRAIRVAFGKEMTACYAKDLAVREGVEYHASFWAKGEGTVQLTLYQYSESGHFLGSKFLDGHAVGREWQRFEEVYKTPNEFVTTVAFALHVLGEGAWAVFDDASFTYDATKYPPPKVEKPETTLVLQMETRNATVKPFLNGAEVALAEGKVSLKLAEGPHVLALTGTATGSNPGVRVSAADRPYLRVAFRSGNLPQEAGWLKTGFDDSTWPRVKVTEEGWMWPEGNPTSAVFRQVLSYTHTHYGPQRCISPRVKQWSWPQRTMQVINLWLRPLDEKVKGIDYHFILEAPKPFRMLETDTRCVNWFDMMTPRKVEATEVIRGGVAYTRYDIAFPPNFHAEKPMGCFTAVCLKPEGDVKAKEVTFYYRRQPSPNQSELEVAIPVRMLPAANGKMPKQVMQWSPIAPVEDTSGVSSREEALEIARLHAAMGINLWSARPDPFARSQERKDRWDEALREYLRLGGRYGIWLWNSLGLNYGFADYFAPGPTRYLQEHPEIQARWFKGQNPQAYGQGHFNYCNEWGGSEESKPFWEEIQKTYAMSLANWPKPEFFFFDWEYARIDQQGNGNHCFCERCNKSFREFAKIPAEVVLEDETIVKKYSAQWTQFRCFQDARIYGQIKKRCNAVGQRMMLYVAGGDIEPLRYAKGCIDILHEGTPGNGVVNSSQLDNLTRHFAEMRQLLGDIPMLPQMLPCFPNNGLNTEPTIDGYYHPKLVAVTNLIGVLATRGGGMEHWLIPIAYSAGAPYYLGESNRLIATFEDFFTKGERHDDLVSTSNPCGKVVVLTRGKDRLILAFNDKATPQQVKLTQKECRSNARAHLYFENKSLPNPATMDATIPGEYLTAIFMQNT